MRLQGLFQLLDVSIIFLEPLGHERFQRLIYRSIAQLHLPAREAAALCALHPPLVRDRDTITHLRTLACGKLLLHDQDLVLRLREPSVKQPEIAELHQFRRHHGDDLV